MYKYADIVQSLLGVNLYCISSTEFNVGPKTSKKHRISRDYVSWQRLERHAEKHPMWKKSFSYLYTRLFRKWAWIIQLI